MDSRPHETLNEARLLPGVGSAPEVEPEGRWVAAAVAAVLAAEHEEAPVGCVGPPPEGIVLAIAQHRVTTLLAPHATALGLNEADAERLVAADGDDRTSGLTMVVHARAASAALADAGVDHLLVKGVALATMAGRRPATRGHGDLDLWVRPADLATAEAALVEAGWWRRSDTAGLPAVGSGWRWRLVQQIGKEVVLEHATRADVDLHWRLCHEQGELRFGFDEAWAASVALEEVGAGVRGLGPQHALAHVAYHARKEHYCILRQCVDIVDLARVCAPDQVAALAATDPNVALALAVVTPLAPWLGGIAPPSRRVTRLATEVQRELGSTRWTHTEVRSARHASRLPTHRGKESWLLRSAPRRRIALRHLLYSLVPLRRLTEQGPHTASAGGAQTPRG